MKQNNVFSHYSGYFQKKYPQLTHVGQLEASGVRSANTDVRREVKAYRTVKFGGIYSQFSTSCEVVR